MAKKKKKKRGERGEAGSRVAVRRPCSQAEALPFARVREPYIVALRGWMPALGSRDGNWLGSGGGAVALCHGRGGQVPGSSLASAVQVRVAQGTPCLALRDTTRGVSCRRLPSPDCISEAGGGPFRKENSDRKQAASPSPQGLSIARGAEGPLPPSAPGMEQRPQLKGQTVQEQGPWGLGSWDGDRTQS